MKRLGLLLLVIVALFFAVNSYADTVTSANVVEFATFEDPGSFVLTFNYTGNLGDWVVGTYNDTTDAFTPFDEPSTVLPFGDGIMEIKTIESNAGIINFAIEYNGPAETKDTVWFLSQENHTVLFSGDSIFYPGFYDQIIIDWDTGGLAGFNFEIANADELVGAFAPVPIPATALLFCSSILGIVGIRKKISK